MKSAATRLVQPAATIAAVPPARAAFVALVTLVLAAGAHAKIRSESLDAAAASADLYQVTCFDDGSGAPLSLVTQIRDAAPTAAPLVGAQIRKATAATSATDPSDGDAGFSPAVFVNGGAGVYDVFVDKTAAGAEDYDLFYECMTGTGGGGVPTGSSIFPPGPPEVPALPFGFAIWLAALLLGSGLAGVARSASAHGQTGSLGTAASATDYYQVTCSNDGTGPPASLAVELLDLAPVAAPLVSVQVKRGSLLVNASDPVDGDGAGSPVVAVNGGAGVYEVLIDKSAAGADAYELEFHCTTGANGTGLHTGTAIGIVQNQ
jgi:hypothetical protein